MTVTMPLLRLFFFASIIVLSLGAPAMAQDACKPGDANCPPAPTEGGGEEEGEEELGADDC